MLLKAFLDILFPPLCHGCKVFIPDAGELHLCESCRAASPTITSPSCTVCGVPFLTEGGMDHRCGACSVEPPAYAAARGAVLFEGPVRDLIHRFKYGNKVQHSRPLALLTAQQCAAFAAACAADFMMPVPLHIRRLRQRGFNQAVLLGEILAKQWRAAAGQEKPAADQMDRAADQPHGRGAEAQCPGSLCRARTCCCKRKADHSRG